MSNTPQDDLFQSSKMTFGEHLEELRAALLKAVTFLFLGFLVGLLAGNWVVKRLQDPLKAALERYYESQEIDKFHQRLATRVEQGETLPADLQQVANLPAEQARAAILKLMGNDRMIPQEMFIDAEQVLRELHRHDPQRFAELKSANPSGHLRKADMIRVFLWRSLQDDGRVRVTTLSAQEAFMVYIKASLLAGVVFASPLIFHALWSFVASGLYPHERRYVYLFGPISLGLFIAGALLAFFFVFQYVLDFLFGINAWLAIDPDPRISEWLSFALILPVGFGVSFQLPLVMLFLERIGIFTVEVYRENWRIAVVVIAVISMLLTPADPMSMILMAAPLTVLYFGGIGLCLFLPKGRSPFRNPLD